ncbi:MAG: bifunctional adenosylcobinamide kinase/adenosylcobinamide-phosphate guanylyltransferase [Clostridia bacterium]|nr:bifunctional adenosylcobinamide kinase/adenosylcobinamide-phosphate guanylyltransferase [Clostridia bacterium]
MELIIGGAYQGKLTWAVKEKGLDASELCDLSQSFPSCAFCCFYHLEALSRRAVEAGMSADEMLDRLDPFIENSVVISREIGSGIVPMDAFERLWREEHGRLLSMLASRANRVTRIFCGLAEVLK